MNQTHKDFFFQHQCPKRYREANLRQFSPEFQKFGSKWAKKPTSVFLFGPSGTGKTHYVFALIREFFDSCPYNLWPRYFTSTDLDSRLLNASRHERSDAEKEEIKYRSEEGILFIDDFGRETKSDRMRRQYFEIINYRYSEELPTIITSNYTLDSLSLNLDSAICSRIQEWEYLEFSGKDLRSGMKSA